MSSGWRAPQPFPLGQSGDKQVLLSLEIWPPAPARHSLQLSYRKREGFGSWVSLFFLTFFPVYTEVFEIAESLNYFTVFRDS